jgi:hypothetical protein
MGIRNILRIAAVTLLIIAVLLWYFGNLDGNKVYMEIVLTAAMVCFLASFLIGVNYFTGRKP